ncbi:MAG TPA: XRE family transcriptional regulator [Gammaproteobacteria bacterium]
MEEATERPGSHINGRIARRVRALRKEHALSLESLAARSGVSRSMLSLIERGESSPTAVILDKIAAGFGVPLAALFDDPASSPDPISRSRDRTPWRDPESGYVRCNISPPGFPSPIQIVEVMLPAGAKVAYDSTPHGATIHQQIWMQEGSIELAAGGTSYRLSPGDCLAMRLGEPIVFHNRGRKPARYVVVLATERSPRS